MAKAVEPRLRRLSRVFGAYALLLVALAYVLSPFVTPYLDPGATFLILAAYTLLGAVAAAGIGAGAVRRAVALDSRLDELLDERREVRRMQEEAREAGAAAPTPRHVLAVDSGHAEIEVEELLDQLQELGESTGTDAGHQAVDADVVRPADLAGLLGAVSREIHRTTAARAAVASTLIGPALVAAAVVGVFAPLLPAADGMLLADPWLNAFFGILGLGLLVGVAGYAAAAFRQLRRRARP